MHFRLDQDAALRRKFRAAEPFEHLVLDGFTDRSLGRALAAEFPAPDEMRLSGNYGSGQRAIYRALHRLGPGFQALDFLLRSASFLKWASGLAGTELMRNPANNCGGLFQDSQGMELDPHVDVNCTVPGHRRRLTLILYLNRRWRPEWGGALELYPDPARPARRKILPVFNRCVVLASHERAWHAFTKIRLPPARRATGRRALIVNLYGKIAVARDAAPHYNTWMPRPLPKHIEVGRKLTPRDMTELRGLLDRRDGLLREFSALTPARRPDALPVRIRPGATLAPADARAIRRAFALRKAAR